MKKKQKWTVFSILGLLILLVFAAICIAPFIYMVIMSFTQSTTLMLHWSDINFGDFTNYAECRAVEAYCGRRSCSRSAAARRTRIPRKPAPRSGVGTHGD